jgi:hypothetical protein
VRIILCLTKNNNVPKPKQTKNSRGFEVLSWLDKGKPVTNSADKIGEYDAGLHHVQVLCPSAVSSGILLLLLMLCIVLIIPEKQ